MFNFQTALMLMSRGYKVRLAGWHDWYLRRSVRGEPSHPTMVVVKPGMVVHQPFITETMVNGAWVFANRRDIE